MPSPLLRRDYMFEKYVYFIVCNVQATALTVYASILNTFSKNKNNFCSEMKINLVLTVMLNSFCNIPRNNIIQRDRPMR